MVLTPNTFIHRLLRRVRRLSRFSKPITLLASAVTGLSFLSFFFSYDNIRTHLQSTLLSVLMVSAFVVLTLLLAYSTVSHQKEKKKAKNFRRTFTEIHIILEEVRKITSPLLKMVESKRQDQQTNTDNKEPKTTWNEETRKQFIQLFEDSAYKISVQIEKIFHLLGYEVSCVCIKSFHLGTNTQYCVARSDGFEGHIENREQTISKMPFTVLLQRTFDNYQILQGNKDISKLHPINSKGKEHTKRFLAIEDIYSKNFPKVLSICEKDAFDTVREVQLYDDMKKIIKNRYTSFLGILVVNPCRIGEDKKVTDGFTGIDQQFGFIGVDSQKNNVWDFLQADDIQLISAIADIVAIPLRAYEKCRHGEAIV